MIILPTNLIICTNLSPPSSTRRIYPDGTPKYENTMQYAILKSEWH